MSSKRRLSEALFLRAPKITRRSLQLTLDTIPEEKDPKIEHKKKKKKEEKVLEVINEETDELQEKHREEKSNKLDTTDDDDLKKDQSQTQPVPETFD